MPVLLFPRRLVSRKSQKAAEHKTVLQFAGGQIEEEVEEVVASGTSNEITNRLVRELFFFFVRLAWIRHGK